VCRYNNPPSFESLHSLRALATSCHHHNGNCTPTQGAANNPARKTAEEREADRAKKGLKKRKDMDKVERAEHEMWDSLRTAKK
jgi:hypothetical protein